MMINVKIKNPNNVSHENEQVENNDMNDYAKKNDDIKIKIYTINKDF